MAETIFVVTESPDGGFEAEALDVSIYTEADDWNSLRENIKEAISCHFEDGDERIVRMHFVKDEVLTV